MGTRRRLSTVPIRLDQVPTAEVQQTYWFRGEYRDPSQPDWTPDAAVGHSFDLYDNGTLSTVYWDDIGGDKDLNDIILEVAIVYRSAYFGILKPPVLAAESDFERFVQEELPKLRPKDRPPESLSTET